MRQLPEEGFIRLRDIINDPKRGTIGVVPVSRTQWYDGIKRGKYPPPVKLGPRLSVWRVSDIRRLIDSLSSTS